MKIKTTDHDGTLVNLKGFIKMSLLNRRKTCFLRRPCIICEMIQILRSESCAKVYITMSNQLTDYSFPSS